MTRYAVVEDFDEVFDSECFRYESKDEAFAQMDNLKLVVQTPYKVVRIIVEDVNA